MILKINQLSTNDFAGHLVRHANLSAKAIEALAAYCKVGGNMVGFEARPVVAGYYLQLLK